jgi:hypothetical protein
VEGRDVGCDGGVPRLLRVPVQLEGERDAQPVLPGTPSVPLRPPASTTRSRTASRSSSSASRGSAGEGPPT